MALLTFLTFSVALHPEGVDRNSVCGHHRIVHVVALHPEGVDRNTAEFMTHTVSQLSPSTRRAWIEIRVTFTRRTWRKTVALHPEGVDRNTNYDALVCDGAIVALHPEGVDRNRI